MEYPIVENGKENGRLMARQEGLYTVFEARLPSRPALTRLYLCGGGESRLLGVMEPGDDGCRLCRRPRTGWKRTAVCTTPTGSST